MDSQCETQRSVFGVDFSGAQDAGRKIWITEGTVREDCLAVESCQCLADRDGISADREDSMTELTNQITREENAVFGLDFPFGLPAGLSNGFDDWEDAISWIPDLGTGDDPTRTFYDQCLQRADDGYQLRETDARHAALCPYHWMIHKQTYYGISGVLAELADENEVSVLPMQEPDEDSTCVLEVYPAATLERVGLFRQGYKGGTDTERERRKANFEGLQDRDDLDLEIELDENDFADDSGGHALDSLVAAYAVFRNLNENASGPEDPNTIEGHIYV